MYGNKKPLCTIPADKRNRGDVVSDRQENNGTGGKWRVERFADGSTITHFGGPCGSVRTDKFGREC